MKDRLYANLSLVVRFMRFVNDEFVVSTNVDERVLGEIGSPRTSKVDIDQVGLSPEGSKSKMLHPFPPGEESGETGVILGNVFALPRM